MAIMNPKVSCDHEFSKSVETKHLLVMAITPIGELMVIGFVGNDSILARQIKPVL